MIEEINDKKYKVPDNITERTRCKYVEVIDKGWARYLDVLVQCGQFCMQQQFTKLLEILNTDRNIKDTTLNSYSSRIIKRLEELKFIGSDYINNYKFIYLRQPSFSLVEGDYINNYRINFKKDFKSDKFLNSILRVEYFLEYKNFTPYSNMHEQLYEITKDVYDLIVETGNGYEYDLKAIEKILDLKKYSDITKYLNTTNEYKNKLGIIRPLWNHLGKEYWKMGRHRQTISSKPFYLKYHVLNTGEITIHYIPKIIIIDSNRELDYFKDKSNSFFYMFFDMPNNNTLNMQRNFIEKGILGSEHDNILGYTVEIIGSDEKNLRKKIEVLNEQFGENEYSPMVTKSSFVSLNIDKYINKSRKGEVKMFNKYEKKIEEYIKKEMDSDSFIKYLERE